MKWIYLSWCVVILLYLGFTERITAQTSTFTFRDIDNKLKSLSNPDSLIYYLRLGTQLSREKNHIHNWVSYTLEYLSQGVQHRRDFNEGKLLKIWRDPVDYDEASISVRYYVLMGYYYAQDGNIQLSTQYYSLALSMHDSYRVTDVDLFGEILKPLGNNFLRLGDFDKGAEVSYRMRDWVLRVPDPGAEASSYNFTGLLHKLKGEQQEAITAFQQGLAVPKADHAVLGKIASNLSLIWSELGDDDKAQQYALEALAHLDRVQAPTQAIYEDLASTLMIIAQIKLNQRDVASAHEFSKSALTLKPYIDRRTYAKMLVIHGRILRMAGYPDKAIDDFNSAIGQFLSEFNPEYPYTNPKPDGLPAENTIFESLEGKADAFSDLFHATDEIRYLVHALDCHQLALESELSLRRQLSTEFSRDIIASDSKRRNTKALDILARLHRHGTHQDYAVDALLMMESAKANSILESVYLSIQHAETSDTDTLIQQLAEKIRVRERELHLLRASNINNPDQIRTLERALSHLKLQLAEEKALHLSQFSGYSQVLDSQFKHKYFNAFNILHDSAQLLFEYFLYDNAGYAVVAKRDGSVLFKELRDADLIQATTTQLVSILHSRSAMIADSEIFRQHAHWLYQRLVSDVIGDIEGITSLVIVPDGVLNYLPFEMLISRVDSTMSYEDTPYLIRDMEIHYAHSAGVLWLQQEMQSKSSKGIAFAPFFQKRRGLDELAYSKDEIGESKPFRLRRYVGKEGSFKNFLSHARDSRIIHLATHASVDSTGLGHIEFADSTMLLTDVYYLPLQCDLAILSACESAFGMNTPSEGIQNFARAFAIAGTKSIIASHWRLNDVAGATIIGSFYKYLHRHHSVSSALRQAKLDYLANPDIPGMRKSPHYWASIVMIGSDGEIASGSGTPWFVMVALGILILFFVWVAIRRDISTRAS
ncbi:MAG TPA: CHAT domain-containing protein [Saprospiraceae bacterium]|nr:CHAT domain-containing protein [Saprospiraceae bacterium]